MPKNSRAKGARTERQLRDKFREAGYEARRGQQYCGANGDADVFVDDLPFLHVECKGVERLNIWNAVEQSQKDAAVKGQMPIVAHTKNHKGWLITMPWDEFVHLLRGDHLDDDFRVPAAELVDGEIDTAAAAVILGEAHND